MEDLNVADFSKFYKQKLEEGKRVVKDLMDRDKTKKQKTPPQKTPNSRQDILQSKLEDVKRLFDNGIIDKSESDNMRKKLFDEYIS
jgi:polyhydroxyalkanoate synthesis regulator phasin